MVDHNTYIAIMRGKATILIKISKTKKSKMNVKGSSFPFQFKDFSFNENIGISASNKKEKIIPKTNIVIGLVIIGKTKLFVEINCGKSGKK